MLTLKSLGWQLMVLTYQISIGRDSGAFDAALAELELRINALTRGDKHG